MRLQCFDEVFLGGKKACDGYIDNQNTLLPPPWSDGRICIFLKASTWKDGNIQPRQAQFFINPHSFLRNMKFVGKILDGNICHFETFQSETILFNSLIHERTVSIYVLTKTVAPKTSLAPESTLVSLVAIK